MRPGRTTLVLAATATALALLAASCGSGDDAATGATSTSAPAGATTTTTTTTGDDLATPVAGTGVEDCFDATTTIECPAEGEPFFLQDGQVQAGGPLTYTDNGDGTVTDERTGLVWQQEFSQVAWADAEAAAAAADTGGFDDWRVPTIDELWSLIDLSGDQGSADPSSAEAPADAVPFVDTDVFDFEYPDTSAGGRYIDAQYLTGTEYVSTTMQGDDSFFGVNFADGRIKAYPKTGNATSSVYYARFVRGGDGYGDSTFTDGGDGTVTDDATGLVWMQVDSGDEQVADAVAATSRADGTLDWQEALAFCADLSYAGVDDWRLPDAKELQGLVDYSRSPDTTGSAAIDPVFATTPITDEGGADGFGAYWTSTSFSPGLDAYIVNFGEALGLVGGEYVDAHGAGSVRTDPKQGEPQEGAGPQGDIRRVYDFARCVRDDGAGGGAPSPL
ncbi:MAG: DUF1566 domain-containing protein [Microthrixaceae bacterium]|nr:DUF1566 domain-containing protein [Microthrixaceae bacterium]